MPGIFDEFPRYITQPFSVLPSSQEKKEIVGYFSFPDDFSGFQGHFPGNPLLPGIVQISLARFTAAQGGGDLIQHIKRCKFVNSIKPRDKITVKVKQQSGSHHYQAEISANNKVCSVLTFSMQPRRSNHEALSLV
jgi:3-hydroxymyristoyl/3-hydroxydecanoyl-(acyl carrier protein) dehydratase